MLKKYSDKFEDILVKFRLTLYSWIIDLLLVFFLTFINPILLLGILSFIGIIYTFENLFLFKANLLFLILVKIYGIYLFGSNIYGIILLITLYNQIKLFMLINKPF